jgi:ribosome-associated protein
MLNALADGVLEKVRLEQNKKGRKEGSPETGWIIIDYGDIVVHIFYSDQRKYYKIEEILAKGKVLLRVQ